jgi:hypothetical protein
MWFWKASTEATSETPVPYSTFYPWVAAGKIDSVVLDVKGLTGKLKGNESVNGKNIKRFHSNLAPNGVVFLPLLHERKCALR